jgi:hypothetical protein
VGGIFDSPKGSFFEAIISVLPLPKAKDTTGRRQKPALALSQALLDVPPDARRDGVGNCWLLNAGCLRSSAWRWMRGSAASIRPPPSTTRPKSSSPDDGSSTLQRVEREIRGLSVEGA